MRAIERGDFASGARKQLLETTRAHAKQRFMRETQFRFRNQLEIHELLQRGVMHGANVSGSDE